MLRVAYLAAFVLVSSSRSARYANPLRHQQIKQLLSDSKSTSEDAATVPLPISPATQQLQMIKALQKSVDNCFFFEVSLPTGDGYQVGVGISQLSMSLLTSIVSRPTTALLARQIRSHICVPSLLGRFRWCRSKVLATGRQPGEPSEKSDGTSYDIV